MDGSLKETGICQQSLRAMKGADCCGVSCSNILMLLYCSSESIPLGVEAIKWVVKLKQKPPVK